MKRPAALPLALVLCLASPAMAETAEALRQRLDTNGDGILSRGEFVVLRQEMFARIDADHSQTLTAAEIETARAALPAGKRPPKDSHVWAQDANADGLLTLQEYTSATPVFDRADRNHDGALDASEYARISRLVAKYLP